MESLARIKTANERRIRATWGVEVPRTLPGIPPRSEVRPRPARDVAARAAALCYVTAYGLGSRAADVRAYLDRFGLWTAVSGVEARTLRAGRTTAQQRIDFTWRMESAQELAWTLGLADADPLRHCDDDLAERLRFRSDPTASIRSARRRPLVEIQRECDLLFRLHWYAVECRVRDRTCEFSESLVRERRRAIEWVYGVEADWDEISDDT